MAQFLDKAGAQIIVDKINELHANQDTTNGLLSDRIGQIEAKIPAQATASNQVADRAFVNSTVQTATANFRGNWTNWASVPTAVDSYPADYAESKTPTTNDYMVVQDASDYSENSLEGTWRFKYTGDWVTSGKDGWTPEYQVNEKPLTAAQLSALNSGATAALIKQITTNQSDIADIQDRQDTFELQFDYTKGEVSDLVTRMSKVEEKNTSQDTAIKSAQDAATTAQNGVTLLTETINETVYTKAQVEEKLQIQDDAIQAAQDAADGAASTASEAKKTADQAAKDNAAQNTTIGLIETTANEAKSAADAATKAIENCVTLTGVQTITGQKTISCNQLNNGIIFTQSAADNVKFTFGYGARPGNPVISYPSSGGVATELTFPRKAGTVATTADIPSIPSTLPPSGTAGGDLAGSYPNPTIATGKVTKAKCDSGVQASLDKADNSVQLSGAQTIAGTKHFRNETRFGDPNGSYISFKPATTVSTPTSLVLTHVVPSATAASYTYSFPYSSGTLALKSDITWNNLSGKPAIPAVDTAIPTTEISAMFDF